MCLAVPAKVASIENDVATCTVGQSTTTVTAQLMLMEDGVEVGDYLIIHAGFAIRKLDPKEAEESLAILREIVEAADAAGLNTDHDQF